MNDVNQPLEPKGVEANETLKYEYILNLTQEEATPELRELGVIDPDKVIDPYEKTGKPLDLIHRAIWGVYGWPSLFRRDVINFLHKWEMPERVHTAAWWLAKIVAYRGAKYALIGGDPIFMPYLEEALYERGIIPVYAIPIYAHMERMAELCEEGDESALHKTHMKRLYFVEARPPHRVLERLPDREKETLFKEDELDFNNLEFYDEETNDDVTVDTMASIFDFFSGDDEELI